MTNDMVDRRQMYSSKDSGRRHSGKGLPLSIKYKLISFLATRTWQPRRNGLFAYHTKTQLMTSASKESAI